MRIFRDDSPPGRQITITIITSEQELYDARRRMPECQRSVLDALNPNSIADQLYGLAEIARTLEGKS